MLRIRQRQIADMFQRDERSWLRFVCSALAREHPRSPLFALDPAAQLVKARDFCGRARANDLRADAGVLGFVFMMHELAPDFDQHPYVRALLDRAGEPVEQRWERLFDEDDEALDRAFLEIQREGARAERSFHIERFARIEEAFPVSYRDPRFVRHFEEVKSRTPRDGG
jgi:hypothetical protein